MSIRFPRDIWAMNVLAAMKSFMSTWELAFQTLMRPPIALCWQFLPLRYSSIFLPVGRFSA